VKPNTRSKIAKTHLGDANAYMKIVELNRNQLKDPESDQARPGAETALNRRDSPKKGGGS
jgi:hypothetical protein